MTDVFLSHNSADTESVESIATALENEGITFWLDTVNLIPGESFTEAIEKALKDCGAIAVFIGKSGIGPYQKQELDFAVSIRGTGGARIIPVLLPGGTPEMATVFLQIRNHVQFREAIDEKEPLRSLIAGIKGIEIHLVKLKGEQNGVSPIASPKPPPSPQSPYKPLAMFGVGDHQFFCGRDRLTTETVSRVEAVLDGPTRFFAIIGGSGSGKSSLARAGVLWSLQQQHAGWTTVILEPGTRPHETLADRMLKLIRNQVDALTLKAHGEAFLSDAAMLQRSIVGALGSDASQGRLLLLVDQFEEVFTICESEKARQAFIANLMGAARDPSGKAVVLICMRAEFYENCTHTEMVELLSKSQLLVGPMQRDELRSAIRDPASRAGGDVEPALVTSLVRDCEEQASPLPLLQIVLEKLWQNRNSAGVLTLEAYDKMTFAGAINEHAEAFFNKLSDSQQRICQSVMLQLAEPLEDGRYSRRRVPAEDLLPPTNRRTDEALARAKAVETVLGLLSGPAARLITVRFESAESKVEISHEVIFRGWERLAAWLDHDREFLAWKRRLDFDLSDWKNNKTKNGYLTGGTLDRSLGWLKEKRDGHTEAERRFIEVSALRRTVRRVALVASFLVVIGTAGFGTYRLRYDRQIDATVDKAGQLLTSNPNVALLLAYDAFTRKSTQATREMLQTAVQNRPNPLLPADKISDLLFSKDGKVIAASAKGVLIWPPDPRGEMAWYPDGVKNAQQLEFTSSTVKIAVSPDSQLLAAGSAEGNVMVWSNTNPAGTGFSAGSKVRALAITNDGHVAIATNSQTLIWRNTQNSQESHVSTDQKAWSIAVLPGSSTPTVAVGTIGAVRFWNPPAASLRDGFHDQNKPMNPVDFVVCSSNGAIIASSSLEGNAYQWNLNNTAQILRLNTPEQLVRSLAMDSAGNRIAILTTEGVIAIFAAGQTKPEMILQVQPLDISQIAMNADGSVLAAASSKGVRIYELKDKALAAVTRVYLKDALMNNQSCMGVPLNRSNCEKDLTEINKDDQGISK